MIIKPEFKDTEDGDGFFSGWDPDDRAYEIDSWGYNETERRGRRPASRSRHADVSGDQAHGAHGMRLERGRAARARRLDAARALRAADPQAPLRPLHARAGRAICGCSPENFLQVAEALCENSGRERTSAIVYAVGWTQHTVGVQNIRAASIIQLLLGNIGRPGRGDPGAARPRQHPGLDGHSRRCTTSSRATSRCRTRSRTRRWRSSSS